ncbi:MaoC family dehydratase N-terminal domain-containing protein [Candidatus Puniceispirillum sp.]|nr:MaoC family dehydratase N-terminal domain-containing protein [Candidatus Puniceispirillum sp.]
MEFSEWIGNCITRNDVITERMVDHFRLTLGQHCFADGEVPAGLHWCLSPEAVDPVELGPDGHPKLGGFLPNIPYPRRMWAGGWLEFEADFRIGDKVQRLSRIDDITFKSGNSGNLCFVSITHEFTVDGELKLRERHNVVYRETVTLPAPLAPQPDTEAAFRWHVDANEVMLFRYSALTFNGHRIHYDLPYSTDVEGHGGLLVHGPLQATLMLNIACTKAGRAPRRMDYRGVRPLVCGELIMVDANLEKRTNETLQEGNIATCVRSPDGNVTMQGTVSF